MGFISYSMSYYSNELQRLDSSTVTEQTIYRAKQLLKILDDLADEGYTELNQKLEEALHGISRLRAYLKSNNAEPFRLIQKSVDELSIIYGQDDFELVEAINAACEKAMKSLCTSDNAFLNELLDFSNWIEYKDDTAYVFLLRDTLLPYVHYKSRNNEAIYPWLISRKTLTLLSGKDNVDDEFRASIINALEFGSCRSFNEFCNAVLPNMSKSLSKYPKLKSFLEGLFKGINKKHIIVVESGCSGTFPMLLMCLDSRVDVRMYTTYPYLLNIYGDRIYTPKYENNRLFETLYSQDLYFTLSGVDENCFMVRKCHNADVEKKALDEIKAMLK